MIKLMDLVETDTPIDWWNKNRERLNEVINSFNDWQIKHRFESFEKEILKEKIRLCEEYGNDNDFSDWQFEMLNDMKEFIKNMNVVIRETKTL